MLLAEVLHPATTCSTRPALKFPALPEHERNAPQALMRHSIGRSWRRSLAGGYPDALLGLLRSFWDVPDPSSPFSVHNLCVDGAAYGCLPASFRSLLQLQDCFKLGRLLLTLVPDLL